MPDPTRGSTLTSERTLTLLAVTPGRIEALTAGLSPAQLRAAPASDEWSVNDVLAHLRACSDVWGNCIAAILAAERPTLRGADPRNWMQKTDYREQEFRPSLRAFATQRADLLAALEPLPPEGWSRAATVMAWGQAYERTVLHYAERLARHERSHLKQIERIAHAMA